MNIPWTVLISQHAKCGQGRKALRLYEEVRKHHGVAPSKHTFITLLKVCSRLLDLEGTKKIHSEVVKSGFESDIHVGTMLVDAYAKCRSLVDARHIFEKMPRRDVVSWTAMILGYARMENGSGEALRLYIQMQQEGVVPNDQTYLSALKACSAMAESGEGSRGCGRAVKERCLETVRTIHTDIMKNKSDLGVFLGTMLLAAYAKCGNLVDARRVFESMPHRTVISWTVMISGYTQMDKGEEALKLYKQMLAEGIVPDSRTYLGALKACSKIAALEDKNNFHGGPVKRQCLETVRTIHADIKKGSFETDVFVANLLVDVYAKCGSLDDARRVFDMLPRRDVVSWTAMILGYTQMEKGEEALQLFARMQEEGVVPNGRTYVTALKACSTIAASCKNSGSNWLGVQKRCLDSVRAIHADIRKGKFESDLFVGTMLVDVYTKCGSLKDARCVFEKMPQRSMVSWTAMILGYAQMGNGEEALQLYTRMQREGVAPDGPTYISALKACSTMAQSGDRTAGDDIAVKERCLETVRAIHTDISKGKFDSSQFVGNMLVNAYARCGSLEEARCVFEKLRHRDVVSWNAMISGYAQMAKGNEALQLYTRMQTEGVVPDSWTYVGALKACTSVAESGDTVAGNDIPVKERCLETVKTIHKCLVNAKESNLFVETMLVDAYARCGSLGDAECVFENMPHRDVASWNAMILGYTLIDRGEEALRFYTRMQEQGVAPDGRTYISALNACGILGGLEKGKEIHAQILRLGVQANDSLVTDSLIDMYGKCGSMEDAQEVFDGMPRRETGAWNTLIAGYAHKGESRTVFDLFYTMKQNGVQPNAITFLAVLTACSHAGLVDKGQEFFEAMSREYGIAPTIKHFTCMTDLLGRAGHLHKAMDMLKTMCFEPNSVMWRSVLGACQKWGDPALGRQAMESAVRLNQDDGAAYVLMSNIYAAAHLQQEAKEMQAMRVKSRAWKQPGCSWSTDLSGTGHVFVVGDQGHPATQDIYAKLGDFLMKMKESKSCARVEADDSSSGPTAYE